MCKVVKYWFACNHAFRLRHSKCGGTKHKNTRAGLSAACKSDPYLNFVLTLNCGPCQYQAFESRWKQKLGLAEIFLERLKKKGFPGVQEVDALVEQMREEFTTATWGTRSLFPHAHKQRTVRVGLGHFGRSPSPLSRIVLPEDIPEPLEIIGPEHPEYEYDYNQIASTDPLHPVDSNYAHPLDECDTSWTLNHLSSDELEQSGEGVGFDASEVDTAWAVSTEELNMESMEWGKDTSDWQPEAARSAPSDIKPTQGSELLYFPTLEGTQTDKHTPVEHSMAERIDMVVHEFWSLVNGNVPGEQSSRDTAHTIDEDIHDAFKALHLSDPLSGLKTGLLTPPPTPPRLSTNKANASDFAPQSPPNPAASLSFTNIHTKPLSPASQSAGNLASNPTTSFYDSWRRHISPIKHTDRARFSRALLYLSRCEIRDVEGPSGRAVLDPQPPQDGGVKIGLWR